MTHCINGYVGCVVIPESVVYKGVTYSVTTIGECAFYHSNDLTSITIPNSVTTIGYQAFWGCSSLEYIVVDATNPIYDSRDNCNAIMETSSNTLISGCKNTIIPNSVTTIGEWAFGGCSGLTSITIPNSVTTLGNSAFCGCKKLSSITIPNSVTAIGESTFQSCSSLTSITIGNSVTTIGDNAFSYCSGLTFINIPNSVTTIGEWAFLDCSGLTSVIIGNSVATIGKRAFWGCNSLEDFYCHADSVPTTGENIFPGEIFSATLHVPEASLEEYYSVVPWGWFEDIVAIKFEVNGISYKIMSAGEYTVAVTSGTNKYVDSVVIPETVAYDDVIYSVTTIGHSAFTNCKKLTSITIPNSVTTIGDYAFYGCSGLPSITIPNSVTTIGDYAFSGCSSLPSITIPDSVTTIGNSTFKDCKKLPSITIPNSVTTIGEEAFSGCNGLTSIVIPGSVTTIGKRAFYYCTGLTSITIPNNVTTIGEKTFFYCRNLTSITIGKHVTKIDAYAFSNCSTLKDFYCHAESIPTVGNYIFSSVKLSSATLHVPETSLQEYASAAPWSEFGQIVALTESDGIERLTSEANSPATAYGLDGRRVAKPRKGIYVIGGRKTVVR